MTKSSLNRRKFIRTSLTILTAAPLFSALNRENEAFAQANLPAVDPASPKSQSFGYVHDATKVDVVKFPKRAGAEGAKQLCSNCQLMIAVGMDAPPGHEGKWGKCALFPEGLVAEAGWCNQWIQKVG